MGYHILLISSCQMSEVKNEKVAIIVGSTCNFVSSLLHGDQNMVTFCSTVERVPLIFLCLKSRLCVDFNIDCIVSIITSAGQEKGNKL